MRVGPWWASGANVALGWISRGVWAGHQAEQPGQHGAGGGGDQHGLDRFVTDVADGVARHPAGAILQVAGAVTQRVHALVGQVADLVAGAGDHRIDAVAQVLHAAGQAVQCLVGQPAGGLQGAVGR